MYICDNKYVILSLCLSLSFSLSLFLCFSLSRISKTRFLVFAYIQHLLWLGLDSADFMIRIATRSVRCCLFFHVVCFPAKMCVEYGFKSCSTLPSVYQIGCYISIILPLLLIPSWRWPGPVPWPPPHVLGPLRSSTAPAPGAGHGPGPGQCQEGINSKGTRRDQ